MTILVAAKADNGRVFIGSDSQSSQYVNESLLSLPTHNKWSIGKFWAVGVAGEIVAGNIINELMGKIDKEDNVYSVVQIIRDGFVVPYWAINDNEKGGAVGYGFSVLLTDGITIWETDSSLGFHESEYSFLGSGRMVAFGAWFVLENQSKEMSIIPKLRIVLEATCMYDLWCGAPIEVLPFAGRSRYAS